MEQIQSLINDPTASFHGLITEFASLVHTRPGSRLAMILLGASSAKERKAILKELKPYVKDIVCDDAGWMVLCRAFDCVDDTVLLRQTITQELFKSANEAKLVLSNKFVSRLILYLLAGTNTRYFSPDFIASMNIRSEFVKETSKKDPAVRRREVLSHLVPSLLEHMDEAVVETCFHDWQACQMLLELTKYAKSNDDTATLAHQLISTMQSLFSHPLTLPSSIQPALESATAMETENGDDESDDDMETDQPTVSKHYLASKQAEIITDDGHAHVLFNNNVSRFLKRLWTDLPETAPIFSQTILEKDMVSECMHLFMESGVEGGVFPESPFFIYLALLGLSDEGIRNDAKRVLGECTTQEQVEARGNKAAAKLLQALKQ